MTHPLTPREKVEDAIREHVKVDATGLSPAVASVFIVGIDQATDAILTALASGSGDHAELEGAAKRLADIELSDGGCGYCDAVMDVYGHQPRRQFYRDLKALLAENAALRAEASQANANGASHWSRATEAERKRAEAAGLLRQAIEPYEHISNVRAFEVMKNGPATRLVAIRALLSKEAERG